MKAAKETGNQDLIDLLEEKRPKLDVREYKTHCVKLRLARKMKAEKAKLEVLE